MKNFILKILLFTGIPVFLEKISTTSLKSQIFIKYQIR